MEAERSFRAMGTTCHVIVRHGGDHDLDRAQRRIAELEAKWSRFIPTSELCRLNANAGKPCVVSRETRDVIAKAVEAWHATDGLYDPTILPALQAAGYDRTFTRNLAAPSYTPTPAPGCRDIVVGATTVTLPHHVAIDLGGIGKGYAADLVTAEAEADAICMNIGGDIRVRGTGWVVAIEDPANPTHDLTTVTLDDNAVATTSRAKRHWGNGSRHHLIDPRTGTPADTDTVAITVTAPEAWQAETLAKAAFLRS